MAFKTLWLILILSSGGIDYSGLRSIWDGQKHSWNCDCGQTRQYSFQGCPFIFQKNNAKLHSALVTKVWQNEGPAVLTCPQQRM